MQHYQLSAASRVKFAKVSEQIDALDPNAEFAVNAQKIVEIFKGCHSDVWTALDNAVGNAHSTAPKLGYLVRQVRNNPTFGRQLFANLR